MPKKRKPELPPPPEYINLGGRQVAWRPPAPDPMPVFPSSWRLFWRGMMIEKWYLLVLVILIPIGAVEFSFNRSFATWGLIAGWFLGNYSKFRLNAMHQRAHYQYRRALEEWSANEKDKLNAYVDGRFEAAGWTKVDDDKP